MEFQILFLIYVSFTTASGPTLSISFAETVLIELANAFSKLPFRGTGCQFLGDQASVA
jgi:hypothetical protein